MGTEGKYIDDVIKKEFDIDFNRDVGTLASGQNVVVGEVLMGALSSLSAPASGNAVTCISLEAVDASIGALAVLVLRRGPAVVLDSGLDYGNRVEATAKADLLALGIKVVEDVTYNS